MLESIQRESPLCRQAIVEQVLHPFLVAGYRVSSQRSSIHLRLNSNTLSIHQYTARTLTLTYLYVPSLKPLHPGHQVPLLRLRRLRTILTSLPLQHQYLRLPLCCRQQYVSKLRWT
jgi:hypothetical protein